ncbi:hypothetical protein evm_001315 [Chilo suppressalis]|nr:hypothetical protein evm_001315 [Chilo suppressalis]
MSRLLSLWSLICCVYVAATPFKRANLAEDTPHSNLQLLIPLKLGDDQEHSPRERGREYSYPKSLHYESDGPYSQIPAEFFHQDGVVHALKQSLEQKTVKKDLNKFPQSKSLREELGDDRSILPFVTKVNDEDSIARCDHFLPKSISSDKESDYNHLLKNLCLLHLQLRTNEPSGKQDKQVATYGKSDGFGWDSNGEVGRGVFANLLGGGNNGGNYFAVNDKTKGKLGNLAVNGYGGYAGNLGVGGKGQYVGNLGVGGTGGVYGNLAIGGQGALFGNLGIGGKGGKLDNAAFVQDDWTANYQNSLLELLLQGKGLGQEGHNNEQPQHIVAGAEINPQILETDGKVAANAHVGQGENGMFLADAQPQHIVAGAELNPHILETDEKVAVNAHVGQGQNGMFLADVQPQHIVAGAELNPHILLTDEKGAVNAHMGEGDNGMFLGVSPHGDGNVALINSDSYQQKVRPINRIKGGRQRSVARDSNGYESDDCVLRSYLFNGKGGLVGNLAIDNYSVSSLMKKNPCIHVYEINLVTDKKPMKTKHNKHLSSAWYLPLKWFRPINGRRDWTSLGGNEKKLRQYISMTKPLLIV